MILKRWQAFAPALIAILYGAWLVLTAPADGFADLAGAIVVGVGILAAVLGAAYLIADVYWWHARRRWWVDLLVGIACVVLALGGFALLGRA